MPQGKTDAQPRQTGGFGQRAQHQQIRRGCEVGTGENAVAGEGLVQLIDHHQRRWCCGREFADDLRCQAGPGGVIRIADQEQSGLEDLQALANRLQRKVKGLPPIGNRLDRHPLHLSAGRVIAEGRRCGEQRLPAVAIGVKDGVDGCIDTVEQADLLGLQR